MKWEASKKVKVKNAKVQNAIYIDLNYKGVDYKRVKYIDEVYTNINYIEVKNKEIHAREVKTIEVKYIEKSPKIESEKIKTEKTNLHKKESEKIKPEKLKPEKLMGQKIKADKIKADKIRADKIKVEKYKTEILKTKKIKPEKLKAQTIIIEKTDKKISSQKRKSTRISEKIVIGNEKLNDKITHREETSEFPRQYVINQKEQEVKKTTGYFCGYKYRFGLYAAHSNISYSEDNMHFHNFTITIYINAYNCAPDDNYNIERAVQDWLTPLQGKQLNQTELFQGKETTIEGMGDIFYDLLYDQIEMLGYELVKLSIFENPIRVYSVSRKRLDSTVNEISRLPLECIPIINLDGNTKKSIEEYHSYKEELEVNYTVELENKYTKELETEYIEKLETDDTEKLETDYIEKLETEYTKELETEFTEKLEIEHTKELETEFTEKLEIEHTEKLANDNKIYLDNDSKVNLKNQYTDKLKNDDKENLTISDKENSEKEYIEKYLEKHKNLSAQEYEATMNEAAITMEQIDTIAVPSISGVINKSKAVHITNIVFVIFQIVIGLFCFASLAIFTMYTIKTSGRYPQGSDTFCHLYRADLILQNIQQGNWFPLYDSTWYNGVEIMRYWGPIPLYIIAGLEWLSQTNVIDAYVIFLGFLIVLGGCGWLLWGVTYNKIGLSIVIGLLWFYMPENMRVVIYEGNLPRGVINALLPFYFYFVWKVMVDHKKKSIFPLILVTSLITLCHLGITIMLLVTAAIFIFVYAKINHTNALYALGASIAGVLLAGLWVVPALIGGAASGASTNQVMKNFFENAAVSLSPFTRLNGDLLSFYFGFSIFLICILGIVIGSKKVKPGFITAVILFLCTTKSVYAFFEKLPFSQFLWMIRFIPIGLAAAMLSFLMWKELRKWVIVVFCILLTADCATSFQDIYFPKEERIQNAQKSLDERAEITLITKAKEITKQRLAILDLSRYGSFAPFYVTGVGKVVNYAYGAGWEGANTATNIVNLNASVENGWYVYLFDRALELGNDTVLIPIDNLKGKAKDIEKVIKAAKISGYNLVGSNATSILFHRDTDKQFGVITKYQNIAIGASASGMAMIFPNFEEGSNNNISAYTYEELSKYHSIYLSGFVYDDRVLAEELLLKLANNGVQIYIDMNRIPIDKVKKSMEIFGVNAQTITLTDTYPELLYKGNPYQSLDFSYNMGEWNTIYLDGLEQIEGSFTMTNKNLAFMGTSKNKNLHFIGLNLVYYLQVSNDTEVKRLVGAIFGMNDTMVPDRKLVPISVKTSKNKIKIDTKYDNVNTTLSSIDIFHSKKGFRTRNNLITVNSGSTVIDIKYPHIQKGILVTVFGIILAFLIYALMREKKESEIHDEISKKESP